LKNVDVKTDTSLTELNFVHWWGRKRTYNTCDHRIL